MNPIKVILKMFEKVPFLIFALMSMTSTSEAAADCGPCQGNVLKLASHLVNIHLNFKPLNVIMNQTSFLNYTYRIYLSISREILDKIWSSFYQFDIYAGHKTRSQNFYFLGYITVNTWYSIFRAYNIFSILDSFCNIFFQFDLYAGRLIRENIRFVPNSKIRQTDHPIQSWSEKNFYIYYQLSLSQGKTRSDRQWESPVQKTTLCRGPESDRV